MCFIISTCSISVARWIKRLVYLILSYFVVFLSCSNYPCYYGHSVSWYLGSKGFCRQKCHFSFVKNAYFVKIFVKNAGFCHFCQPDIRTFVATFSPNFFVTNVFVRSKRSMTRVTNYNVTSDIINTVKLTKPVMLTFKMLLIIHWLM